MNEKEYQDGCVNLALKIARFLRAENPTVNETLSALNMALGAAIFQATEGRELERIKTLERCIDHITDVVEGLVK